jgi:hypothetical protein
MYTVTSNFSLGGNTATWTRLPATPFPAFELEQSYPNPFNPISRIRFTVPIQSKVVLRVFNILGSEVATLFNQVVDAGATSVEFDASGFAAGVYFYRLEAFAVDGSRRFIETRKALLVK